MSDSFQVKISREGNVIGTYEAKEAIRLFLSGTLKDTDFYWHQGMNGWAPLPQLQASFERIVQAEAAQRAKIQKFADSERLGQEGRGLERNNAFVCNCCQAAFEKPKDPRGFFWQGLGFIFMGTICPLACAIVLDVREEAVRVLAPVGLIVIFLSACLVLWGLIRILSSGLRSPFCPSCHSTNFSRPRPGIRVFK